MSALFRGLTGTTIFNVILGVDVTKWKNSRSLKFVEYCTWWQRRDFTSTMDLVDVQNPEMVSKSENLTERWKRFRQHVELMFSGPLATKKEEEKCSYLLIRWVEQGRDITNIWMLLMKTEGSSRLERCSNYVERKCNPAFSRYKFHKRVQTEAETVEKFVTDLKHVVRE